MKFATLGVALLLLLTGASFASDHQAEILMDQERAFAKATDERGIAGWMEFMAPNAVELSAEPFVGLDQIRAGMGKQLNSPGFKLTWGPTKAEFLGKGENMGFAVGRYELHYNDANGKPQVEHGSYLTTWQKQKDGSWKVVSDIGNPDPPSH